MTESADRSVYGTASPSARLLPGTSLWPVRGLFPDCKSFLSGEALPVTVAPSQGPTTAGEGSFARTRCAMPFPGTMCKGIQVRGQSQSRRDRRNGRIPRHRTPGARCAPGPVHATGRLSACRQQVRKQGEAGSSEMRAVEESLPKSLCPEAGSTVALWGGTGLCPRGARSPAAESDVVPDPTQ